MTIRSFRIPASILLAVFLCLPASAADLTGTWIFSVDLKTGEHGDPVFVLKVENGKITGTYDGPFGDQGATGKVNGNAVELEVATSGAGETLTLSYAGEMQGDDRMSGTMTRNISGKVTPGKFTATRRK